MNDLPLGSIDYARYLLAQAEIASGATAGIERSLRKRLNDRAISAMEIFLERERMHRYIRLSEVDAFVERLPAWVNCQIYLNSHREDLKRHGVVDPFYGEIASANPDDLKSPLAVATTEDALLAFGMVAALQGRGGVLSRLHSRTAGGIAGCPPTDIVNTLLTGKEPRDRLVDIVAQLINLVTQREDLTPSELFTVELRFVHWVSGSSFKPLLVPMLVSRTRERWNYVVNNQRFYLRTPAISVSELQTVLNASGTGLAFIGKVLLVASGAVGRRLDAQYRDFLLSLSA